MSSALAIASGKGGVGKTTMAVNLALIQAKKSNCLLLDADMGMANAHILLGLNPKLSIREVIEGKCNLEKIIARGPNNLKFISGGTGITELLGIENSKRLNLIRSFENLSSKIDNLIVDVSAGAEDSSLRMISATDKILIVLVNEPTSFMDAFTLIKVCNLELGFKEFCVTVNMVNNDIQGKAIFLRFNQIVTKFYDVNLSYVGSIPLRNNIKKSILNKKPVVLENTSSDITNMFNSILDKITLAPVNKFNGIKFFNNSIR